MKLAAAIYSYGYQVSSTLSPTISLPLLFKTNQRQQQPQAIEHRQSQLHPQSIMVQ